LFRYYCIFNKDNKYKIIEQLTMSYRLFNVTTNEIYKDQLMSIFFVDLSALYIYNKLKAKF